MKIVSVHEGVVPISSSIRNAWIDFSSMDSSIVAVVSDVVRDGEPVVGYGFNSNGRYSAGEILRRRVVPRLLAADPESLLAEDGQLDPARAWDVVMTNEKPGGHGERSVAVGALVADRVGSRMLSGLVVLALAALLPFWFPYTVGLLFGNLDIFFPALYGLVLIAAMPPREPIRAERWLVAGGVALAIASLTSSMLRRSMARCQPGSCWR